MAEWILSQEHPTTMSAVSQSVKEAGRGIWMLSDLRFRARGGSGEHSTQDTCSRHGVHLDSFTLNVEWCCDKERNYKCSNHWNKPSFLLKNHDEYKHKSEKVKETELKDGKLLNIRLISKKMLLEVTALKNQSPALSNNWIFQNQIAF